MVNQQSGLVQPPETAVAAHLALLKEKKYCDVTFCIGPSKNEIKCHKIFLTARSVVFETMFSETWNTSNIVNIPDTEPEDFQMFLEFLYCDTFTTSISGAVKLLPLGHKYQVDSLVKKCEELMSNDLQLQDCIETLKVARTYSLTNLKTKARDIMTRSFSRLCEDASLRLDEETLIYLLRRNDLPLAEIDIFTAVLGWARDKMDGNSNYPHVLKKIIPAIRFPLMSSLEFASKVVPTHVLPQKDVIDLFLYFNTDGAIREDAARNLSFSTVPRKGPDQVELQLYEAAEYESLSYSTHILQHYSRLQEVATHEDILQITHKPGAKSLRNSEHRVMKLTSVVLHGLNYDALRSIWSQRQTDASIHHVVVSVKALGVGASSVHFEMGCVIRKGNETEINVVPSIEIMSNCKYEIAVKFQNAVAIVPKDEWDHSDSKRNRIDHMTNTTLKLKAETTGGGTIAVTMVASAGNSSKNSLHVVRGLKFVWE